MTLELSDHYKEIQEDFNNEVLNGSMFSKQTTECDRLTTEYLGSIIKPGMKVLEVGAGMGNIIENLLCEQYAIDISEEMLKYCRCTNKLLADMNDLPFKDNFFDIVYMVTTLQQSHDQKATVKEAMRVLKKGGQLVIVDGDADSDMGKLREEQLELGQWATCGKAKWLYRKDFKGFDVNHLNNYLLLLTKTKR